MLDLTLELSEGGTGEEASILLVQIGSESVWFCSHWLPDLVASCSISSFPKPRKKGPRSRKFQEQILRKCLDFKPYNYPSVHPMIL
jgi:hypothetical protein